MRSVLLRSIVSPIIFIIVVSACKPAPTSLAPKPTQTSVQTAQAMQTAAPQPTPTSEAPRVLIVQPGNSSNQSGSVESVVRELAEKSNLSVASQATLGVADLTPATRVVVVVISLALLWVAVAFSKRGSLADEPSTAGEAKAAA